MAPHSDHAGDQQGGAPADARADVALAPGTENPHSGAVRRPGGTRVIAITLARKPLVGTVAQNALQWGTGGLNIDECRIATTPQDAQSMARCNSPGSGQFSTRPTHIGTFTRSNPSPPVDTTKGRWPANVILAPQAAAALDAQSGVRPAGNWCRQTDGAHPFGGAAGSEYLQWQVVIEEPGGAARYFKQVLELRVVTQ